jgi:hypothetical protein
MLLTKKLQQILFISIPILFISCKSNSHNKSEIESAMKLYDRLLLKMDADSISMLYTPDGILADKVGRDSIKFFLSSFKDVRVLSQSSVTSSIDIINDTAIQKGTYTQTDLISEKDTIKVKGEYVARWQWYQSTRWLMKQMTTKPIN